MSNSSSKKTLFIIIIGLLLLINGVLFFSNRTTTQEKEQLDEQLTELKSEQNDLLENFKQVQTQLEGVHDSLVVKDSIAVLMNNEIQTQKDRILGLLGKRNITKAELSNAKIMIDNLRNSANNYQRQIEALKQANVQLSNQNMALQGEVVTTQQINEQLQTEKMNLEDETSRLSEVKEQLESTIERAAVIQTGGVRAAAVRYKGSKDKEVVTERARRADKLRVCFELVENTVARVGEQEMIIRILSPTGVPLFMEALDSGYFTNSLGENMKYTTRAYVNYSGERNDYCMYWEESNGYEKGTYAVEIYNQAFLVGETSFALR